MRTDSSLEEELKEDDDYKNINANLYHVGNLKKGDFEFQNLKKINYFQD